MNSPCRVVEHQPGERLRLQAPEAQATNVAADLLGLLEAELQAEVEDTGLRRGHRAKAASPVLIRLESLEVELTADANEIVLTRVGGSDHEFEALCEFLFDQTGTWSTTSMRGERT